MSLPTVNMVGHLIDVCWYLTVVFTCTSLVTSDVIHPLMCLFVTYIYSLMKYLFTSLAHVFNWNFVFLLNFESSLYILYTSLLSFTWPASISCLYLVLHFLDSIFWRSCSFLWTPIFKYLLLCFMLLVLNLRNLCLIQDHKAFLLCFSLSYIILGLI